MDRHHAAGLIGDFDGGDMDRVRAEMLGGPGNGVEVVERVLGPLNHPGTGPDGLCGELEKCGDYQEGGNEFMNVHDDFPVPPALL